MASAIALVFQPGQVLAGEIFVQEQEVQPQTEGQAVQIQTETQGGTENQLETEPNKDGWEEAYTDTDSRRGTLSVRCEVFQGFHGMAELQIRSTAGGWERSVALDQGGGYAVNLPLPVGTYRVAGIKAETDGRKFHCFADQMEMEIEEGKIAMCRITISPDNVYNLPYVESTETAKSATSSDGNENRTDKVPERPVKGEEQGAEYRRHAKFHPFWILGISGAGLCLYGFYVVVKRRNEMGG